MMYMFVSVAHESKIYLCRIINKEHRYNQHKYRMIINTLSNHRQLIEQRYGGNLSVKQLAQQRGATPGGLSQLLFRIRAALLTCIQRRLTAEADA